MTGGIFTEADVISRYTKEQQVEDGQAVEVPADLREQYAIKAPVYVTIGLWGDVEHVTPEVTTANLRRLLIAASQAFRSGDPTDMMRTDIQYSRLPDLRTFTVWGVIDGDGVTLMHPSEY